MFLETSRGKYVGFILTLGVNDLLRSLEVDIVKVKGTQKYPFSSYKSPQCVVIVVVVVYI